jgi:hypothetical protein
MKTEHEYYKNMTIQDIEIVLLDSQYAETDITPSDLEAMKEALRLIQRAGDLLCAKAFIDDSKASYFASNLIGQLGYYFDKHIREIEETIQQ